MVKNCKKTKTPRSHQEVYCEAQCKLFPYTPISPAWVYVLHRTVPQDGATGRCHRMVPQDGATGRCQVPHDGARYHRTVAGTTGQWQVPQDGARCHRTVPGATGWCQVPQDGARCHRMVPRHKVPGTRYQVPCTKYLPDLPGTWYQAPGTRHLVPGKVPGT